LATLRSRTRSTLRRLSPPRRKTLDFEHDHEFSLAEQRKIRHKIDRRLIIMCGAMYCVSLMDRTNLGAAVLAGMAGDLDLIDFRYSTIALVFFVTYVICQPPATILCRKIGPRYFLATITLFWGIVEIGFGFPKTWTEMIGELGILRRLNNSTDKSVRSPVDLGRPRGRILSWNSLPH